MTSEAYYLELAAPRGSAFYYSVSHLKSEQRAIVLALQALYLQLIDIVYQSNEASVAQIKFQWWRHEIQKISANEHAEHPLSPLLQQAMQKYAIKPEDLIALIDGVEEKIHMQPFMNFEELTIHIMRTAGLKEKLLCVVVKPDINVEIIYQLALINELISLMQHLRQDVNKGIIFFPVDELDKYYVTVAMLEHLKTTAEIEKFLKFQTDRVLNLYADALKKISSEDKIALRSLMVRNKIAVATLKEIQKEDFHVLEQMTALTPLHMWWLAWS
jgi:phytoene synthase